MKTIETVISHNGSNWILRNNHFTLSAPTIEELDLETKRLIKEKGLIKKGEKVKVLMAFDNSTIPQWIRQYAQHYFNRIIVVHG
jgi:hypothetical protein